MSSSIRGTCGKVQDPCQEALRQLRNLISNEFRKAEDVIVAKEGLASGTIERHRLRRERQYETQGNH
jgi:hypothetical protein